MPPAQKYNRDRDAFLGMSNGTAANRLRKRVLFRCVQRLGEDVCYRCSLKIESPEELSIEHKKSWMNVDPVLFWDLDNIAFSHLKCNCEASDKTNVIAASKARSIARRKVGPEGTAWCGGYHKAFLPVEVFHKNRSHWNGVATVCKECANTKTLRGRDKRGLLHGET